MIEKETYVGLFLSGIKRDKSKLLVIEKFKKEKRLVVSKIEEDFKALVGKDLSDELLLKEIKSFKGVQAMGVNYPTLSPPCLRCKLKCPGVAQCEVSEVKWLNREFKKASQLTLKSQKEEKRPAPYVERGVDYFVAHLLEEPFPYEPAFSGTKASFYARGQFLKQSLPKKLVTVECSPKLSLWRIGRHLGLRKSILRNFYKSERALENRELFLEKLEKDFFLYQEDKEILLKSKSSFEALICALSAFYFVNKKTQSLPSPIRAEGLSFSVPYF